MVSTDKKIIRGSVLVVTAVGFFVPSVALIRVNRGVHAHCCIMGNQGKMAGNSKICIGIQSHAANSS